MQNKIKLETKRMYRNGKNVRTNFKMLGTVNTIKKISEIYDFLIKIQYIHIGSRNRKS